MRIKRFKNGNVNLQLTKEDFSDLAAYGNKEMLCTCKLWENDFVNEAVTWFIGKTEYIDFYYLKNGYVYYVPTDDLERLQNGETVKFSNAHLPNSDEREEFKDYM